MLDVPGNESQSQAVPPLFQGVGLRIDCLPTWTEGSVHRASADVKGLEGSITSGESLFVF